MPMYAALSLKMFSGVFMAAKVSKKHCREKA